MNMYEIPGISEDLLERARMYNYMVEGGLYPMRVDPEVMALAKELYIQEAKERLKFYDEDNPPQIFRARLTHI